MFTRTYTGADGKTHFEEITTPLGQTKIDPDASVTITHWEPDTLSTCILRLAVSSTSPCRAWESWCLRTARDNSSAPEM